MPWQGNPENLIDRFDVRAHLDIIPEYHANEDKPHPEEENASLLNYERYRILIQNESSKSRDFIYSHL
jgi:arginine/serine-rich splicing factor 16